MLLQLQADLSTKLEEGGDLRLLALPGVAGPRPPGELLAGD